MLFEFMFWLQSQQQTQHSSSALWETIKFSHYMKHFFRSIYDNNNARNTKLLTFAYVCVNSSTRFTRSFTGLYTWPPFKSLQQVSVRDLLEFVMGSKLFIKHSNQNLMVHNLPGQPFNMQRWGRLNMI